MRDFDVAQHQPHPPGYPVFIALGKLSTAVLRAAGLRSPEVRGLAVWSALSGAALIWLLFVLYRALGEALGTTAASPGGADRHPPRCAVGYASLR